MNKLKAQLNTLVSEILTLLQDNQHMYPMVKYLPELLGERVTNEAIDVLKNVRDYYKYMSLLRVAKEYRNWENVPFLAYVHLDATFDAYYMYSDDGSVVRAGEKHAAHLKECIAAHPDYVVKLKELPQELTYKHPSLHATAPLMELLSSIMPMDLWRVMDYVPKKHVASVIDLKATLNEFDKSFSHVKIRANVRFIHTKGTNNKTPVLALSARQKELATKILNYKELVRVLPVPVKQCLFGIYIKPVTVPEGSSTMQKLALVWYRGGSWLEKYWAMVL